MFQDSTIVSLGGNATSGPNLSQDLADEMADCSARLMDHSFACPDNTAAFLSRAIPPDRVDDSTVTSDISPDYVSAALKRLKRDKAAGPDEINNTFTAITRTHSVPFSRHFTPDGLRAACCRRRLVKQIFNV